MSRRDELTWSAIKALWDLWRVDGDGALLRQLRWELETWNARWRH